MKFSRGRIASWALYDFANSILITNGGLYFSRWLIADKGVADAWLNITVVFTSLFMIVLGPVIGRLTDRRQSYATVLWSASIIMCGLTFALSLLAQVSINLWLLSTLALFCFAIINIAYQSSLAVYHAALGTLVPEQLYARVSGYGMAAGWVGAIVGLALTLPFVNGTVLGKPGPANAFLPAALVFLVLAVVSLKSIAPMGSNSLARSDHLSHSKQRGICSELHLLWVNRNLFYYFLFFLFASDSLFTIQFNMPIYLAKVHNFSDQTSALYIVVFLVFSAIGAIGAGRLAEKLGTTKTLFWNSVCLGFAIVLMAIAPTVRLFFVAWLSAGLFFGGVPTLSRALLLNLSPPETRGQHFGLYIAFDRVGAVVGPLLWTATLAVALGATIGYQTALLLMGVLLFVASYFLRMLTPRSSQSP